MSNLFYLKEFKLKKDLAEVREFLEQARYLISIGIEIPQETLDDLLLWEIELEDLLEKFTLECE